MTLILVTKAMMMEANATEHLMAELGAIGISLLLPSSLLQPSPSQILQWLTLLHFDVSDKQPRSIVLALERTQDKN